MFISIQVEAESGARLAILGKKEDDRRLLVVEGRPEARERARRMVEDMLVPAMYLARDQVDSENK